MKRSMIRIPSGTLTKKTQRHERLSVMKPPRVGPMTEDMPNTPVRNPPYLPRSLGGKRSPMMIKERPIMAPAPIPCNPREIVSCVIVWLKPQRIEPITKILIPLVSNHLRPYKSLNLPVISTVTVDATRYAVITDVYRVNPPRSVMIRGMAVPTIVWSNEARKRASITPAIVNTTCRFGSERWLVVLVFISVYQNLSGPVLF